MDENQLLVNTTETNDGMLPSQTGCSHTDPTYSIYIVAKHYTRRAMEGTKLPYRTKRASINYIIRVIQQKLRVLNAFLILS